MRVFDVEIQVVSATFISLKAKRFENIALASALKYKIEFNYIDEVLEVSLGLGFIGIKFKTPYIWLKEELTLFKFIDSFKIEETSEVEQSHHEIEVKYEGEDLNLVSELTKLEISEIIKLHVEPKYKVGMIGFLPGFPYLLGLNTRLVLPRKITPSLNVKAGSVAIGHMYSGIYPQNSPGGWFVLGSTKSEIFDLTADPLCRFKVGDTVKFMPT